MYRFDHEVKFFQSIFSNMRSSPPQDDPTQAPRAPAKRARKKTAPQPPVEEITERRWTGATEPKDSRRDTILRSVGYVLRDSRLSSLTMQSIADELGITKGNLYYYFKDKQDLLFQCRMRCMEISLQALDDAKRDVSRKQVTLTQALRTLLVRHILGILEDGMGNVLLTDLDDLDPPLRERYVSERDRFEVGVRKLIDAGCKLGELQCPDSKLAGFSILGAINWIPKWYHPDGKMSPEDIAVGMSDLLIKTLMPATNRAFAGTAVPSTSKRR